MRPAAAEAPGDGTAAEIEPLPRVTDLDPGMIALREFPLRKWYFVDPLWYYHAPALTHELRPTSQVLELIDPALRELCGIALAAGLCTTPSCQGHFYPRQRFEVIWGGLQRDADRIRGNGLIVTDSETSERFVYHDARYKLPWDTFDEFWNQVDAVQQNGYLGLVVPRGNAALASRLEACCFKWPGAEMRFDAELTERINQPTFGIHVAVASDEEIEVAWAAITRLIREALAAENPSLAA